MLNVNVTFHVWYYSCFIVSNSGLLATANIGAFSHLFTVQVPFFFFLLDYTIISKWYLLLYQTSHEPHTEITWLAIKRLDVLVASANIKTLTTLYDIPCWETPLFTTYNSINANHGDRRKKENCVSRMTIHWLNEIFIIALY